jgi:hypothetical protein
LNDDKIKIMDRNKLYELVWHKPLLHLANDLNIPVEDIKLACKTFQIPLPELGHWQKLEFNKASPRIPLPELTDSELKGIYNVFDHIEQKIKNVSSQKVIKTKQLEIESDPRLNLKVSSKLGKMDPIVQNLRERFEYFKKRDYDKIRGKNCFNVNVSEKMKLHEQ